MRLSAALFGLFCLLAGGFAHAVDLEPGKGIPDLGPSLTYHSNPQANLAVILEQYRSGEFSEVLDASMLDSNYAPESWAATEIFNATIDDGREPDPFVLTLSLAVASAVDIYLVRENGLTENLLTYSAFDPFVPEDHSVTRLRTPQFTIAPQETVTLMVLFRFGPIQSFRMALETPAELEASTFSHGVGYTAFYAFCISCLLFFFGFHLAMRNWVGVMYSLVFAVALAFIAFVDGLLFRFVYPDNPAWHSRAGFGLLFALSGTGFIAAGRSLIEAGRETRASITVSLLALVSLAGGVASLISPGTYVTLFAYGLMALMLACNFVASRQWHKHEDVDQLGAGWISAAALLAVLLVLGVATIGMARDVILVPNVMKVIYSVLLLAVMTSLTAHVIHLRRRHARAVEQQMQALQAEARRSQELLVAEKNYSRARDLASLRQQQLATASHDLKQPIASLRMTFDAMADQVDPKLRGRLHEAFDYMEALSSDYLKDTGPDTADRQEEPVPSADAAEVYELAIILGTVQQLFHEEALSKGLPLRMVTSTLAVAVPPMALMRIVSNLVSNAVKYTLEGRVLIGVCRRAGRAVLMVLDTGPGMDENEIRRFREAYEKGTESSGHGLGLAVCFQLAAEHQLDLAVISKKGSGTAFALTIPLA